jgi:hypothetical protein
MRRRAISNRPVVPPARLLAVATAAMTALRAAAMEPELGGFLDVRAGWRTGEDRHGETQSLAESRLQTELHAASDAMTFQLRADFLHDEVADRRDIDFEEGAGGMDLREAYVLLYPARWADAKLGRQILTWGTGDLLFINDLFPKDWQAFFIGRDEEYLKAPSDAAMVSLFPEVASIDLVYTPRFDADRYIRGERISYWNPMLGRRAGRDAVIDADRPDDWFEDHEAAVRVYRNLGGYEAALYGYYGYWKSPVGYDPQSSKATFPALSVAGASVRGPVGRGLFNAEAGYYDSRDDRGGDDPNVPNGECRLLAGYERELARNLSLGTQYYIEHMLDHARYRESLGDNRATARDENRHVTSIRLTQRLMNQNLTLSLFAYYSPSDRDAYLRPAAHYKLTDAWRLSAGGNVFLGEKPYTFFGQFEDNSNLYLAARYTF